MTGLLVENDAYDWYYALDLLIRNPKLRLDIIKNAEAKIRTDYSLSLSEKNWTELLIPLLTRDNKKLDQIAAFKFSAMVNSQGKPVENFDNLLIEQLNTEKKINDRLTKVLINFFKTPTDIDKLPNFGKVSFDQQKKDTFLIKGWVADLPHKKEVAIIALIDVISQVTLGFYCTNVKRPDIEEIKKLPKDLTYGFSIKLITQILPDNIGVVAILDDGQIVGLHRKR